jgi:hypothetical protein
VATRGYRGWPRRHDWLDWHIALVVCANDHRIYLTGRFLISLSSSCTSKLKDSTDGTTQMRYLIIFAVAAFFGGTAVSFAVGLSDTDYEYLAAQELERNSPILRDLSPKEQATLHAIIGDSRTAVDPTARAKNVNDALAVYREHQLWERVHPGELWDIPRR